MHFSLVTQSLQIFQIATNTLSPRAYIVLVLILSIKMGHIFVEILQLLG